MAPWPVEFVRRTFFSKETPNDRFWFENIHNGVLVVGARLETRAYKYMTQKGKSLNIEPVKQ